MPVDQCPQSAGCWKGTQPWQTGEVLSRCGVLLNSPSLTGWSFTRRGQDGGQEASERRGSWLVGKEVTDKIVCRALSDKRSGQPLVFWEEAWPHQTALRQVIWPCCVEGPGDGHNSLRDRGVMLGTGCEEWWDTGLRNPVLNPLLKKTHRLEEECIKVSAHNCESVRTGATVADPVHKNQIRPKPRLKQGQLPKMQPSPIWPFLL